MCWTAPPRWKKGSHMDSTGYAGGGRQAGGRLEAAARPGPGKNAKRSSCGYQGEGAEPSAVLLQHQTACTWTSASTGHAHRRQRPGWRKRPGGGSRAVHHPGPGRFGGRGGRAGQGAGLRNWLGILKGTLTGEREQGRHPPSRAAQPRPRLHRAQRQGRSAPAWPLADVRAQRGPPDDQPAICTPAADGAKKSRGILDAVVTTAIALHDLQGHGQTASATAAPAASTSSSPRCTARPRWRLPVELFSRVGDAAGPGRTAPSSWASWTKSAAPAST